MPWWRCFVEEDQVLGFHASNFLMYLCWAKLQLLEIRWSNINFKKIYTRLWLGCEAMAQVKCGAWLNDLEYGLLLRKEHCNDYLKYIWILHNTRINETNFLKEYFIRAEKKKSYVYSWDVIERQLVLRVRATSLESQVFR